MISNKRETNLTLKKDFLSKKGKNYSYDQMPKLAFQPNFLDKLFGDIQGPVKFQNTIDPDKKKEFVQDYKRNLRRTVFNETKQMIKIKKQKSNDKDFPRKKQQVQMPQERNKKSTEDSLFKTIMSKRSNQLKRKTNFYFGVNKLPLVKRKSKAKLFEDTFQIKLHERQRRATEKTRRSELHSFHKQDIQPWQTPEPNY